MRETRLDETILGYYFIVSISLLFFPSLPFFFLDQSAREGRIERKHAALVQRPSREEIE
jgi:hypothetical protein